MAKSKQGNNPKNNGKRGYSNRKPSSKRRIPRNSRRDRIIDDMDKETTHDYNDISWYAKNPQILKDVGNLNYFQPLGSSIGLNQLFDDCVMGYDPYTAKDYYIPGLMHYLYLPVPGISEDATSPINLAAQNIYSYVRYMNSGAKNYDMADLILYLMAMDSIYVGWNYAKRIYQMATVYDQQNWYMPQALVTAEGIDFTDLTSNLADYRGQLNILASRISSFCVPAVMPLFIRHSWLCSNIYKDSANAKSQLFMCSPSAIYQYSEDTSDQGGMLVPISLPVSEGSTTNLQTFQSLINIIANSLNMLAYSEDIGIMSGDILKAYGQEKLFKISPLSEGDYVTPVYNEQVLNQLHNATNLEMNTNTIAPSLRITQDPNSGYLLFDPILNNRIITKNGVLVNMPWDSPNVEDTMEATRLTTLIQTVTDETGHTNTRIRYCGSELVTSIRVWNFIIDSVGFKAQKFWSVPSFIEVGASGSSVYNYNLMCNLSQFDWHPLVPVIATGEWNGIKENRFYGFIGDISMYGLITNYSLGQLHLAALLSEFNVPQLGSF